MSKLLVVFGATGQQGGAVVDYVVNDPELSKRYTIRAITRDPSKPGAMSLARSGVEVVKGDLSVASTLKNALHGAHTVFALTTPFEGLSKEQETEQGKAVADASVAAGAQFLIWSTLPNVTKLTQNALCNVAHFDAKADVEAYIGKLPIKSAFFAPGFFMQNFQVILRPRPLEDGTYRISNVVKSTTQVPLFDVVQDAGKFVGAILANPEAYQGQVLAAATRMYTFEDIAKILSQKTAKEVRFKQIPEEALRKVLPPTHATELVEMLVYFRDYGYYGPETNDMVEWSAKQARGSLTTFEDYLGQNPIELL